MYNKVIYNHLGMVKIFVSMVSKYNKAIYNHLAISGHTTIDGKNIHVSRYPLPAKN